MVYNAKEKWVRPALQQYVDVDLWSAVEEIPGTHGQYPIEKIELKRRKAREKETTELLHPHHRRRKWNQKNLLGKGNKQANANFAMPLQKSPPQKPQNIKSSQKEQKKSSAEEVQKEIKKITSTEI